MVEQVEQNTTTSPGTTPGEPKVLSKFEMARDYLLAKKARSEAEAGVKKLEKEFAVARVTLDGQKITESALFRCVDQESLITAKSLKKLNQILSAPHYLYREQGDLPMSSALLSLKAGVVSISVVFAHPIFKGWKTEKPYISYQMCPLSVTVPPAPSENHIPEFVSVVSQEIGEMACWELEGDNLMLYGMDGKQFSFVKSAVDAAAPVTETTKSESKEEPAEDFEAWLAKIKAGADAG